MRMKTCPRCDSSLDDEARYCVDCGAPQTEDAAEELDEYVQRQAQQVAAESGGRAAEAVGTSETPGTPRVTAVGPGSSRPSNSPTASSSGAAAAACSATGRLSSRSRWSRRSAPSPNSRRDRDPPADPSSDRGAAREPAETRG